MAGQIRGRVKTGEMQADKARQQQTGGHRQAQDGLHKERDAYRRKRQGRGECSSGQGRTRLH